MAREAEFMFKTLEELASLKAGVFSYLQRDIDKLIDTKYLDAAFMNFSQPAKPYNTSWIYIKVNYIWYDGSEDDVENYASAKVAIPVGQNLFTRDPDLMDILDKQAKIYDVRDRFNDIDLVKVRILFLIYRAVKDFEEDNIPIELPTKNWIVMEVADAGNYDWKEQQHAPGN